MSCGLPGSLLVLEAMIGRLFEAADVALNSGGKGAIIRGEAQDGCCIAGALWTEPLAHMAFPFPSDC
jgi:hypothetical protein